MLQHGNETLTLSDLVANFSLFDEWEERYRYLIDLGRSLPVMPETLKVDENIVQGCTARVWMKINVEGGKFYLLADSDAHIVRGLIAVLMSAYDGEPLDALSAIDIEQAFRQMGLDQHLSPNRRNGFFAMVERIISFDLS
jgi:cysteine desulfuration protein SufE